MRKYLYTLLLAALVAFSGGCYKPSSQGDDPRPLPTDTVQNVLVAYFMGANNLSSAITQNVEFMQAAVAQGALGSNGRLVVFHDKFSGSYLYELYKKDNKCAIDTLRNYGKINCADAGFMKRVMNDVRSSVRGHHYGFVFGGHGTGWVLDSLDMSSHDAIILRMPEHYGLWSKKYLTELPETRCIGYDSAEGMDLAELAEGLSPIKFDFLLFDACFMASVEGLWELRDAADRFVVSPTEVMSRGMPYNLVLPSLFADWNDLESVCRLFVKSYESSQLPYATISLVEASALPALADAVGDVLASAAPLDTTRLNSYDYIQHYEGLSNHVFFDLDEYMERLSTDPDALTRFREALGRTVVYLDHTERAYTSVGTSGSYTLRHISGLNTYITRPKFPQFQKAYNLTPWYLRVH